MKHYRIIRSNGHVVFRHGNMTKLDIAKEFNYQYTAIHQLS